jgi:hypothetical protein
MGAPLLMESTEITNPTRILLRVIIFLLTIFLA